MELGWTMNEDEQGRAYWERHAKGYGVSLWALHKPLPRMCELAEEGVRGTDRALEVGAGTGVITMAIARTAREVIATDYSEAMIRALETRLRKTGLSNVKAERADIYSLPYTSQSFDAVIAANVLHLVPDLSAAMAAFRRILKTGGKVIVPTFLHGETFVSRIASRLVGLTGFPAHRRFTAGSLREALETQGLNVEREETLEGLIPIGYVEGHFRVGPGER